MGIVRQTDASSSSQRSSPAVKRFNAPERVLAFDKGRLEVITVGGRAIGKGTYAPGWRLSQIISRRPQAAAPTDVIAVMLSGRLRTHANGAELDLMPGDFFQVPEGHDAWVLGNHSCEVLYLQGVELLAERLEAKAT